MGWNTLNILKDDNLLNGVPNQSEFYFLHYHKKVIMNKITLDTFIQKYNLGGAVNSVKWISDGATLSTKFISGDKSLLGHVELVKQTLPVFVV